MTRLAVIGDGKMGRLVASLAPAMDFEVVARLGRAQTQGEAGHREAEGGGCKTCGGGEAGGGEAGGSGEEASDGCEVEANPRAGADERQGEDRRQRQQQGQVQGAATAEGTGRACPASP